LGTLTGWFQAMRFLEGELDPFCIEYNLTTCVVHGDGTREIVYEVR